MTYYALRKNLIDISIHVTSTLILCAAIYSSSGKLSYAALFMAGALLIDLDHLIDSFLFFKTKFDLMDLFSTEHLSSGKIYLFFHSWELVIALFIAGLALNSELLLIFTYGLALHLLIDNVQRKNKLSYLITYRLMKRFDAKVIFPELLDKRWGCRIN